MEHNSTPTPYTLQIPPIAWFFGIGLVSAVIAIFVFNVAFSTVTAIGLIAILMGSHFFMHGSHAGHQPDTVSNPGETNNREQPAGRSGCCH